MTTSAIAEAIANAQKASAGQAAPGTDVATQQTGGAVVVPGKKLSMNDMQGGLQVDKWIKVKEHGLQIGDSPVLITTQIPVTINMEDNIGFFPKMSIKTNGSPPTYAHSYDGITAVGGGTWAAAIAKMQAIDAKAQPYRSADLPFKLIDDLKAPDGSVIVEAGKTIGNSLSTTNWKNFEEFYRKVEKLGLLNKTVEVKLGSQRLSRNNINWGVMTFELVGEFVGTGE